VSKNKEGRARKVVMFSGGPDSTTLLYDLRSQDAEVSGIVFNYGQDYAEQEIISAKGTANRLNLPLEVVDMAGLRTTLLGLPLTEGLSLMGGAGCGDPISIIGLAATIAGLLDASSLSIAFHSGDVEDWPSLPNFVERLEAATRLMPICANLSLDLPYIRLSKADVLRRGHELGVPLEQTVSCQTGNVIHCGKCSRCEKRRNAFREANIPDLTRYQ
jgi:7-cyano-7-deazaguanine synthase